MEGIVDVTFSEVVRVAEGFDVSALSDLLSFSIFSVFPSFSSSSAEFSFFSVELSPSEASSLF